MKIFFRLKHSVANPTDNRDFRKLHKNSFFLHPKFVAYFQGKIKRLRENTDSAFSSVGGSSMDLGETRITSENEYNTHTFKFSRNCLMGT